MNKKSGLAAVWLVIFFIFPLTLKGDWKKDIKEYFHKAHEYESIVKYLETHLENIPNNEKKLAIIILCYAYREIGDIVNEEKWVVKLFENYQVEDPDFKFLGRNEQVGLYEYIQQWKRRFPVIKTIGINEQSQRIHYFAPPEKFYLNINTGASCEISIIDVDRKREIIYSGYLKPGPNTIGFPFFDSLERQNSTLLEIVLKSGTIERKKTIFLAPAYHYPPTVKFEPREGKIAVIGKEFRRETSRIVSHEIRRYFDKTHFMKKAIPHLLIGMALYLLDSVVIRSSLNRDGTAKETKALMNGIDKTAAVLVVGISLKGLLHCIRSFKKEKKETVTEIPLPGAVQHNNALRREILKSKEHIFVTFKLKEA